MRHNPSLQRLTTGRTRMLSATAPEEHMFDYLTSYLQMLVAVEPRFPMGENKEVQVSFTWSDSFKPAKKITQMSPDFERASVMFNLGALESHAGMSQDRGQEDGLKRAQKHFSNAAGIFLYLRDDLRNKITGPVTADLSQEGLSMLYYLMLAQAQACFYEQALKKKLKSRLLSKLAAQASDWYNSAWRASNSGALKSVLDGMWATHLDFQRRCFSASSEFQLAKATGQAAVKTGEGYGEEIARLHRAEVKCVEAVNAARKGGIPESMLGTFEQLLQVIQREKKRAISDNDQIYLQSIPPGDSLGVPPMHAIATATPPHESLTKITLVDKGPDALFHKLMPRYLHVAEANFHSRLDQLWRETANLVESKAGEVRTNLAEAGLPAAVEAGNKSERGFPDSVFKRVKESVQDKGGVDILFLRLNDNEGLAQRVMTLLNRVEVALKDEENADGTARARWGNKWTATASSQLNRHMREDVTRYRDLVSKARQADSKIMARAEGNKELLGRTKLNKRQLDGMVPNPQNIDDDPVVERLRAELSILLVELGSKVSETEVMQTEFMSRCESDSIVPALLEMPGGAEAAADDQGLLEDVIGGKLEMFQDISQAIKKQISGMRPMLSKVLDKNFEYAEKRTTNEDSNLRELVVSEVNAAIEIFETVSRNVEEGATFWADISTRCEQLDTTVADHTMLRAEHRATEDRRLELEELRRQENRNAMQRTHQESSVPSFSPYAAGGGGSVVQGQIVDDTPPPYPTVTASYVAPPPSYNNTGGGNTGGGNAQNAGSGFGSGYGEGPEIKAELIEGIIAMRSALGTGPSDQQLATILEGAKGDVNTAINNYFENPNGGTTPANAVPKAASSKKKGFRFKR